jgi:hypothetical protein
MIRFREHTQLASILTDTERPTEDIFIGSRRRRHDRVHRNEVNKFRRMCQVRYPGQDWIDAWLLQGQEPPAGIRALLPDEIRRCAMAWDYVGICRSAGISHFNHYLIWFDRTPKIIPDGQDRLAWLKWLYSSDGYKQAPAFCVTPELEAYRREGTIAAIASNSVGVWQVKRWKKDPLKKRLLTEAVTTISQGLCQRSDEFKALPPGTQEKMIQFARAAARPARLSRAGISSSEFNKLLREADERGVAESLMDYLNGQGRFSYRRCREPVGHIAKGLFVPTAGLRVFHEAAGRAWVKHRITDLFGLAGMDQWFAACVTPIKEGRRARVPISGRAAGVRPLARRRLPGRQLATSINGSIQTTLVRTPAAVPGVRPGRLNDTAKNGRDDMTSATVAHNDVGETKIRRPGPADSIAQFVPTRFQLRVLAELKERFLTKEGLLKALKLQRDSKYLFYEGGKKGNGKGLDGLKAADLVRNDPGQGRGYYSVEHPPPEIADFLSKKPPI